MNLLCAVYKSSKKDETYLYLPKKDDFAQVPKALLDTFGTPVFVMMLPLNKREKLARVDVSKLHNEFHQHGYYLQIPPPKENLLKAHLQATTEQKN